MKRLRFFMLFVFFAATLSVGAQDIAAGLGARAGVGSDITFGGLAFGGGVNKLFLDNLEVGLVFYYGSFTENSTNGVNNYTDTTKITALAAFVNYLYGYHRNSSGFYLVGGVGLAYLGINWEESSPTDVTLGTLLPGGGSKATFDASSGGSILNLGAGFSFGAGFDLRLEVPIVIAFGSAGGSSTVIPLFTLTGGYRLGP